MTATRLYLYKGEYYNINQLSEISGLKQNTIKSRLNYGFGIDLAMEPGLQRYVREYVLDGKKYTLKQLSNMYGVKEITLYHRINTLKWDIKIAILPKNKKGTT